MATPVPKAITLAMPQKVGRTASSIASF